MTGNTVVGRERAAYTGRMETVNPCKLFQTEGKAESRKRHWILTQRQTAHGGKEGLSDFHDNHHTARLEHF